MKKLFCAALVLCALSLHGEDQKYESYSYWDFHPLHAGGNAIFLGSADVHHADGGNLVFNKQNAFLQLLVPISRTSYFFPRIEWNTFEMNWNRNPKFNETRFYYWQFALTFYTTALDKWRWILRADYNIDQKHFSAPYGLFSGLAWGAYEICPDWHYHVGFLCYSGMHGGWVYPVIGLDHTFCENWRFQIVFPIDYTLEYAIDKHWRLSLKGRPLRERFRVGLAEPQPRSVFNYSSIGTEFNVHYEQFLRFEAECFFGYNFGGNFYIKNENGHQALYTHVGGSPYAGLSLNYGF